MKKFLPKSLKNPSGFSLVELLVVISIIAILAVMGFVAYSGISARARDTRRIGEIDAIAKAMEKNYQSGKGYVLLATSDFVSQAIPKDPYDAKTATCGDKAATTVCGYCVLAALPGVAAATAFAACANPVSITTPGSAAGTTSYVVCANLETNAGANNLPWYCKKNNF